MPLINCPDCNKEVSDKVEACIHCGCPLGVAEEAKEESSPEQSLEVGLVDYIGSGSDAFKFKIRTVDGYHVMTSDATQLLDLEDQNKKLSELEINSGTLVYFRNEFSNDGILKTIYTSKDLPEWLDEEPKFQSPNWKIRISEPKPLSEPKLLEVTTDEKVTKNYLWYLMVLIIVAGYWIAKGTPNPALFFAGSAAKEECLRLANENKGSSFMFNSNEITANDTWLKDGKRVVQLLQKNDDQGMNQIMCIVGNGMVQIPSLIEQGRWR